MYYMAHAQDEEASAAEQLEAVTAETQSIKSELSRLEERNNQLQGYGLDNMSAEELSGLIHGLTQVHKDPASDIVVAMSIRLCFLG